MKIVQAALASVVFLGVLMGVYYAHINNFNVNVVFYAAIFDAVIATLVAGGLLFSLEIFNKLGSFEKFQLVVIWAITGYALAISLPTVIDRSLSFYILEKIHQRGGGIRQEAFEEVFTQEYVNEHHLVEVRLTEQLESGTITIEDDCVLLTAKGEYFVNFSRAFRKHWLPKKRLLLGVYSDALVDPLSAGLPGKNYVCH